MLCGFLLGLGAGFGAGDGFGWGVGSGLGCGSGADGRFGAGAPQVMQKAAPDGRKPEQRLHRPEEESAGYAGIGFPQKRQNFAPS